MRLRTCLQLLAIAMIATSCRSVPRDSDVNSRLDAFFTALHDRGLFDGAVVIGEGEQVVWEKGLGYANLEQRVQLTPDTPVDGASLAKTFTSSLLLMLERDGLLDLDESAQRLLPELPYPSVTLRHLLSHSSGIPVHDYDWFDRLLPPDRARTTELLLETLAAQKPPLFFEPGTRFEYSSLGFDLAALAAARAAGKPLDRLLDERIFRPLGISSAFLRPARLSEFPGVRTLGYRRADGVLEIHEVYDFEAFHGGSNIYISARDLHRWNASFVTRPLLDASALATALQPARIGGSPSGITVGSWNRSNDGSAFWYSGHHQGFHSIVFRDAVARRSIVYVSNNTVEPWLQHAIIRSVRAILAGREPARLEPPLLDQVPKEARPSLAGSWRMADGETLTIEMADGGLFLRRAGVAYRVIPVGPVAFYVPGADLMIGFAGPSLSRIHVSSNLDERWGARESG